VNNYRDRDRQTWWINEWIGDEHMHISTFVQECIICEALLYFKCRYLMTILKSVY